VTAASESIGGPSGDHSSGHPWWTPVRVVLAVAALAFVVGMVQKTPCVRDDWSGDKLRYGAMCYSDVPYLYSGRGFAAGYPPYADNGGRYPAMEYPVLIGYFAYGASWVTQTLSGSPDLRQRALVSGDQIYGQPGVAAESGRYFVVTAVLLAPFALLSACPPGAAVLVSVPVNGPWAGLPVAVPSVLSALFPPRAGCGSPCWPMSGAAPAGGAGLAVPTAGALTGPALSACAARASAIRTIAASMMMSLLLMATSGYA